MLKNLLSTLKIKQINVQISIDHIFSKKTHSKTGFLTKKNFTKTQFFEILLKNEISMYENRGFDFILFLFNISAIFGVENDRKQRKLKN